ncbi:MAG: class I SAM-dependent methyltransferase [Actinobacteria bacterium]|nr:class I SAM-dependent methyltransferase [Actinomycetota bacterium]
MSPQREHWERLWQRRSASDFEFSAAEPPAQLLRLLAEAPTATGPALDVGCGSGVVLPALAERFDPAVGIDISLRAVLEARKYSRGAPGSILVLVAEALALPFGDGQFAFVFDRGCMHNIPRPRWSAYLRELERLLKPQGLLQILFVGSTLDGRGRLSIRRIAAGVGRRLGRGKLRRSALVRDRGGGAGLSLSRMRALLPASLEPLRIEHFPYRTSRGRNRLFTHCIAMKVAR